MKKLIIIFLGIFLIGFLSAEILPFEVHGIYFSSVNEKIDISINATSSVYDSMLFEKSKGMMSFGAYLNGVEVPLNSLLEDVSIIPSLLNVGENEMIIFTYDLTVDENGNFIKKRISNQYGIGDEEGEKFYQRLSNGTFVLCYHYDYDSPGIGPNGEMIIGSLEQGDRPVRITDNEECILDNGGIKDTFFSGPNVGVVTKFYLTQEEKEKVSSGIFHEIIDFSSVPIIGVPIISYTIAGELVEGRKVFISVSGSTISNEVYSVYFNNNFIRNVEIDYLKGSRFVFELEETQIIRNGKNKVEARDNKGNSYGVFVYSDERFNNPDEVENEWGGILILSDRAGVYGDKISVYGLGFKPNKEYTLGISYEGVPGGKIKVITNDLGEFQKDDFEIKPPIFTEIILFVKNFFSKDPEMPSIKEVETLINEMNSVSILLDLDDGGIGVDFYLCDVDSPREICLGRV